MQLQLLPVIAALLAVTQATPVPVTPVPANALEARGIDDCGDSTFINQSSTGSPLIKDCQQLARNIAAMSFHYSYTDSYLNTMHIAHNLSPGNGSWTVAQKSETLVTYGTCAFGASSIAWFSYVGNQDITNLICSPIEKFSWSGKVGSKGTMGCEGSDVKGGIYHA